MSRILTARLVVGFKGTREEVEQLLRTWPDFQAIADSEPGLDIFWLDWEKLGFPKGSFGAIPPEKGGDPVVVGFLLGTMNTLQEVLICEITEEMVEQSKQRFAEMFGHRPRLYIVLEDSY